MILMVVMIGAEDGGIDAGQEEHWNYTIIE